MEVIEILGFGGALAVGVILGLVGGGGSILTVPILVYLLNTDPVLATAYSLFIVGATAAVGAIRNGLNRMIDYRIGTVFAIPAFISVYLARKFVVPAIPESVLEFGDFVLTKNIAIMIFFAILMLLASFSMIRGGREDTLSNQKIEYNYPMIILEGLFVGLITGIVGAGGGFLIIPALVLFAKLPMKKAVATSLLIIAVKSLIGFIGDMQNLEVDWIFLSVFTTLSIAGIFIGIYLNKFINGNKLKKGFGYFVLLMGVYIIIKELL